MKPIKLTIAVVLTLALLFSFCGCMTYRYEFDDFDSDGIRSIEFYDISAAEDRDSAAVMASRPFYTMDPTQHAAFIMALQDLEFSESVPMFMPTTPSFSYAEYVVRITLGNGTYRMISCNGFIEEFDALGKKTDESHCYCDSEAWIDLLHSYCGERACRIRYNRMIFVTMEEDTALLADLLDSMAKLTEDVACEFDSKYFIQWNGKDYFWAVNDAPVIRVDDTLYQMTPEEHEKMVALIQKYVTYWLHGTYETEP